MRGVTNKIDSLIKEVKFLLTRLMRGVTVLQYRETYLKPISTHTPHARRDIGEMPRIKRFIISTHTPHARRDSFLKSQDLRI